jgi:hypothetical protein
MFEKRNGRPAHVCVTDFEVLAASCRHKDTREILRMVPNGDGTPGLAPGNEYWMPVTNMEKRQSISLDLALSGYRE